MPRKARIKCSECGEVGDHPVETLLIDVVDDHNVLLYTCDQCGVFVTKHLSEVSKQALAEAGVFTVDEMSQWIVEELEK